MISARSIFPSIIVTLFLFLVATELNLALTPPSASANTIAFSKNIVALAPIYAFAVLVVVLNGSTINTIFYRTGLPLLLLFVLVSFSFIRSFAPLAVAKEVVHFIGSLFIGACAAIAVQKHPLSLPRTLFFFACCLASLSLLAIFIVPHYAIGLNGRWQGLTSHPNHLGIVCMLGIYAVLSLVVNEEGRIKKLLLCATLPLYALCLFKANSITSILVSLFFIGALPICTVVTRSRNLLSATIKISAIATLFFIGLLIVVIIKPELLHLDTFFTVTGRSSNLTGRLNLWADGWHAFMERPLLGWGFDNLSTLSAASFAKVKYGQFHNGYIDLLVRGGILAAILMVGFITTLLFRSLVKIRANKEMGIQLLILACGILIHNIAETSLLQFPNSLWMLFVAVHFILQNASQAKPKAAIR